MSNSPEFGKRNHQHHSSQSEDEEESLSLCDLPLLPTTSDREEGDEGKQRETGNQSGGKNAATAAANNEASDDFDFGSLVASLDALESEMCTADEVFFRGQILPFRHSVSSASAIGIPSNLTGSISRSESMDRIVGTGLRSSSTASSSRSSSTRSSSINSSASASKLSQSHPVHRNSNSNHNRSLKVRNQFHSFPSPRPYARAPAGPHTSTSSAPSTSKKSALWEIFRLGLVRTPEIELEDLKVRYGKHHIHGRGSSDVVISRNGSSGGSSCDSRSSGNGKSLNNQNFREDLKSMMKKKKRNQRNREKKGGMNLMNSCKCSVGAVEPEKAVGGGRVIVVDKRESAREEREKQQRKKEGEKEKHESRQRKQEISRHHRTFEWLKDLSHAVVLNDMSS